ncbi:hypothetical protein EW093_08335 [Thiospirochaeta perfilievii]|uniref:Highly acidic protein n=1 Tax=Thiospirochaeta perfilievii TaxID=252967 RepID=A0A5C1QDC3_9SPIO|nr:hypothetical protein [Thiospirochaeta perfilievii]QEN04714.1 hypothetical protein EW093_08335 [Thiospirochaeta perfilievii]
MSDYDDYEYDEDGNVSLDDVREDEDYYDDDSNVDWSDNLDDMDSGEWDNQYGGSEDEIGDDDIDPWDLN